MVDGHAQYAETVLNTAFEIDAGSVVEVFGWAGYFGDVETGHKDLRKHFVVENEIVVVFVVVYFFQNLARKGPIAGVVFAEFLSNEYIFGQR